MRADHHERQNADCQLPIADWKDNAFLFFIRQLAFGNRQ
jgi:hypothetical protein